MSDIIHLLPDSVANQIAAGEVIQRPASVIKELVENAIDAGATHIDVLVVDAGRTTIQVIDNGKGMSETDARLSFERHATSKISQASDLFALRTMGFRGEALASIAAVAQVELQTCLDGEQLGTRILISGSKVESQEPVSCPKGSNFIVKNLFYNVPARRKFLKTNATELRNICTEFERIVLVHPSLSFTLYSNETEVFNIPVSPLRQRIMSVFGKKLNPQLLTVDVDTTLLKLHGYVGKPETARKKEAYQYFFVNGRYMRHPYFHHAVMEAYERLIPAGEQISYFLYFDVDPQNIDVNIHPTKTEIKFENEQAIWQIVAAAVREALGKFSAVPTIDFDTEDKPDIPPYNPHATAEPPRVHVNTDFNPFRTTPGFEQQAYSRPSIDWEKLYPPHEDNHSASEQIATSDSLYEEDSIMEKSNLHLQYKGKYILTSVKSGLMLIDQHRAHMRILFDRYRAQLREKHGTSQGVLFPEVLQLPSSEATVLQSILPDLTAIGFDLSDLGGGSYAVNGIPSGTEGLDPITLVRNMLHTAIEKGNDVKEEIQDILALTLARSAAIVYGQVLSNEEMLSLVDNLFACETPNYTPDGKTVLSIVRQEDIEKLFR